MKRKTTIRIGFSIEGVRTADRFAMANDASLQGEAKHVRDSLDAVSQLPPILWPDPYPYEGHPEDYESVLINSVSHTVNGAVLENVIPILNDQLDSSTQEQLQPALQAFLEKVDRSAIEAASRNYQIQFTNPSVCIPCGRYCHICEGIAASSLSTSGFAPVIWVAKSQGRSFHFNIRVQYKFILENA
jgi:hypothetical protein